MNPSRTATMLPLALVPGVTPGSAPDHTGADQPRAMAQQWARQEAAMHCVRLAVQRWRTGYVAADATVPSSQERWFTEVHGHFTAWLTAGGFAQDGGEVAEAVAPGAVDPVRSDMAPPAQGATEAGAPAAPECSSTGAHENSGTKPPFPCPA